MSSISGSYRGVLSVPATRAELGDRGEGFEQAGASAAERTESSGGSSASRSLSPSPPSSEEALESQLDRLRSRIMRSFEVAGLIEQARDQAGNISLIDRSGNLYRLSNRGDDPISGGGGEVIKLSDGERDWALKSLHPWVRSEEREHQIASLEHEMETLLLFHSERARKKLGPAIGVTPIPRGVMRLWSRGHASLDVGHLLPWYDYGDLESFAARARTGDLYAGVREVYSLASQLFRGLAALHGSDYGSSMVHSMVHSDIKPANIFVGESSRAHHIYRAEMGDFGAASSKRCSMRIVDRAIAHVRPFREYAGEELARYCIESMSYTRSYRGYKNVTDLIELFDDYVTSLPKLRGIARGQARRTLRERYWESEKRRDVQSLALSVTTCALQVLARFGDRETDRLMNFREISVYDLTLELPQPDADLIFRELVRAGLSARSAQLLARCCAGERMPSAARVARHFFLQVKSHALSVRGEVAVGDRAALSGAAEASGISESSDGGESHLSGVSPQAVSPDAVAPESRGSGSPSSSSSRHPAASESAASESATSESAAE